MKFFLDTGLIDEIKSALDWGIVDGVTTNPSLVAKTGIKQEDLIKEICTLIDGPVSAEVIATDTAGMLKEAEVLAKIHSNVVIKLPLTESGISACNRLSKDGIKTNLTLCFSANQALLAAKVGATYISPFVGRLDDLGQEGMALIAEIKDIYDQYGFATEILTASIRNPIHVKQAALIGSDVGTMPLSVMKQLFRHKMTDDGLAKFLADHNKTL